MLHRHQSLDCERRVQHHLRSHDVDHPSPAPHHFPTTSDQESHPLRPIRHGCLCGMSLPRSAPAPSSIAETPTLTPPPHRSCAPSSTNTTPSTTPSPPCGPSGTSAKPPRPCSSPTSPIAGPYSATSSSCAPSPAPRTDTPKPAALRR